MSERLVKASELRVGDAIRVEFKDQPLTTEVFQLAEEIEDGTPMVVLRFEGPQGGVASCRLPPDEPITRIEAG